MKVSFIGHSEVSNRDEVKQRLRNLLFAWIATENADTFLFGSRGDFNALGYEVVSELKNDFPHIRRVYVRAEFEYTTAEYDRYLSTEYEESFFPESVRNAGKAAYVKRNRVMIDMCDRLLVYFDENYAPQRRASGTRIAVEYARQKRKPIYNVQEAEQYAIRNPS